MLRNRRNRPSIGSRGTGDALYRRRVTSALAWTDDTTFRLNDVEYVCRPFRNRVPSSAERFCLLKAKWSVELYEQVLAELAPRRIVEVGIYDGGSTALFLELARPEKLLTLDVKEHGSAALEAFLARHPQGDRVANYYGVDQADAARVRAIVDSEFGDDSIDLVVDDASHRVGETRATFNALFPRVRPGGTYLIEDWSWAHSPLPVRVDETPLTVFVFELVVACANRPDVLTEVAVNRGWARVRRGPAPLDDAFDVAALIDARGRALLPSANDVATSGA